MISRIEGKVWDINEKFITVGVGGIGFKVFSTKDVKDISVRSAPISLFTHLVVKEDALDLYGFSNQEELNLFEMIITISGIGPKTALNVLNISSVQALKNAIKKNDIAHLVKVSGIGRKIAEKIVLELKDKIGIEAEDYGDITLRDEIDAVEALKSLGYSQKDAREALKDINKSIVKTGDRIKEALKILNK